MNNQITILDRNNQSIIVDLICYFKNGNKNYIFYNKNEIVQDGLIKMYVAEENVDLNTDISLDEWNGLKKIMQGIITGNPNRIDYLPYSNPIKFNEPKAIALNETNVSALKTSYKNGVQSNVQGQPILNKDILSQNFGNNVETTINVSEPVQISSIPSVQNNFNMESTPVNLNMTPEEPKVESNLESVSSIPTIEPIALEGVTNNIESSLDAFNIPKIEPISSIENMSSQDSIQTVESDPIVNDINQVSNNIETPLNINNIKPGGIDSGFKVSNEPNIFDNPMPYQISEEDINNPSLPEINKPLNVIPEVSEITSVPEFNIPHVESIPVVNAIPESNSVTGVNVSKNDTIQGINDKKIELNNKKIKLFEELAKVFREENELLMGNSVNSEVLENTASNLFNSNGTLNDNEVLK